jgi:hypothetical protein
MTLRSDSYSSTAEVTAFTRHLLGGQTAYNSTTTPTVTEIEKFIDRASANLNMALAQVGFHVPLNSTNANSTAKLVCDDWVTQRATEYTELTQRGAGFNESEDSRAGFFMNLTKSARTFAEENRMGLLRLGAHFTYNLSDGLKFTGETIQDERTDKDDTSLEKPKFKRGLFDNEE